MPKQDKINLNINEQENDQNLLELTEEDHRLISIAN